MEITTLILITLATNYPNKNLSLVDFSSEADPVKIH